MDWYQFSGTAITADVISTKTLNENIKVTVNGETKKLNGLSKATKDYTI